MEKKELVFRVHAVRRMFERGISAEDIRQVLDSGTIIETYPDDTPYPSQLVLGWSADRPIHVVAADNEEDGVAVIVTVYVPDPRLWDADFVRRKKR